MSDQYRERILINGKNDGVTIGTSPLFSTDSGLDRGYWGTWQVKTKVVETFDPESENPIEMQRGGWQAILDNFEKYAEN